MCTKPQNSDQILLLELHTLHLLRNMALYTWHSRVRASAGPPSVFKIIIRNLQRSKNIDWACVLMSYNSDQIFIARVTYP